MLRTFAIAGITIGLMTLFALAECDGQTPVPTNDLPEVHVFVDFSRGEGGKLVAKCAVLNAGAAAIAVGAQPDLDWDVYDGQGEWHGNGSVTLESAGNPRSYVFLPPSPPKFAEKNQYVYDSMVRKSLVVGDSDDPKFLTHYPDGEIRIEVLLKILVADPDSKGIRIQEAKFVGKTSAKNVWSEHIRLTPRPSSLVPAEKTKSG